ncbi:sensor histidine kinase [Micromonospora rosaria]|uniref:sensor histidine kinase n=1 Tax=Micromonospora rosaria TaxID=47874 RepID=UPI000832E724|nr:histidine kinase [Micromonospora rosaria]
MRVIDRASAPVRAHPTVADLALAVTVSGLSLAAAPGGLGAADPTMVGCVALTAAAVTARRRRPLPALAVALLAATVERAVVGTDSSLVGVLIALYTACVRTDRRTALLSGTVAALVLAGGALVEGRPGTDLFGLVIWAALGTSVGDAVRNRRAYTDAMRERAERAERTREEEARRRVLAERIRIARDLHDAVAHHIALVNAQAGIAVHLMDRQPELAREALGHIRETSRSALDELRATVGLLRQSGDPAGPRDPVPGLADLDDLVASFRHAGLVVEVSRDGGLGELPPLVDLSAYRIVQEALTNVHKHAGVTRAWVRLGVRAGATLDLLVSDRGGGPGRRGRVDRDAAAGDGDGPGHGHGLIGMRERAEAVGGTFRAGPRPGGGFEVAVELPLPGDGRARPAVPDPSAGGGRGAGTDPASGPDPAVGTGAATGADVACGTEWTR